MQGPVFLRDIQSKPTYIDIDIDIVIVIDWVLPGPTWFWLEKNSML